MGARRAHWSRSGRRACAGGLRAAHLRRGVGERGRRPVVEKGEHFDGLRRSWQMEAELGVGWGAEGSGVLETER
jgi:hypothetical protein